jgi:hypothetical protein
MRSSCCPLVVMICRCVPVPTKTLQLRAQATQAEGVFLRYQTRVRKRNSLSVRAPTGQMSTTFPE